MNKIKITTVRFPIELYERLSAIALKQGDRSIHSCILQAVGWWVAQQENEEGEESGGEV